MSRTFSSLLAATALTLAGALATPAAAATPAPSDLGREVAPASMLCTFLPALCW